MGELTGVVSSKMSQGAWESPAYLEAQRLAGPSGIQGGKDPVGCSEKPS